MSDWRVKYYTLNIFLRLRTTPSTLFGISEIPYNATVFCNETDTGNIVYLLN